MKTFEEWLREDTILPPPSKGSAGDVWLTVASGAYDYAAREAAKEMREKSIEAIRVKLNANVNIDADGGHLIVIVAQDFMDAIRAIALPGDE